jgi:hypothetical protein
MPPEVVENAGRDHGVGGAAHASVLRGQELAAKPDGISSNRNAAAAHPAAAETEHNSRAADRACRENLPNEGLGAGPRAARPASAAPLPLATVPLGSTASELPRSPGSLELRWSATVLRKGPSAAVGTVHGSGGIAADDAPFPVRWPGTAGNPSNAATARLPSGSLGCNSVAAVVQDETRVHNL